MKIFTVIFYSDPGHGWAKCKREVLKNLGIANKVSAYSYQRNGYVYLEEDCDYSLLVDALRQRNTRIKCVERSSIHRSRIRSYDRYANV
jgi:hypothetical protein